ncbi:hypothetical protein EGW08_008845 [Elysia chlorotica]|uniref:Uncharacterized protein n=1 Tax=Elysia chlorotica TaxID=188477 RepID=A0A433TP69_ELYCH|nr:hypothetical protein EGW08_008845 [Elysia chlorotica]
MENNACLTRPVLLWKATTISTVSVLGQRCRAEGGGGGGGGAAQAQVSSPAMTPRTWSFSPRSLFSFSSSSSSAKGKLKKKHQQQQKSSLHSSKQHDPARPPQYPGSSSNSSPGPCTPHWCERQRALDSGGGGLDNTGRENLQSHSHASVDKTITIPKASTCLSLSLPLTPRVPIHTPLPRAPAVVPAPPSLTERYRQLMVQRAQSQGAPQQQHRNQDKPQKDKFRFRRWHPNKRKRSKPASVTATNQQQEGDYHRLAHHLGQGHYKGQAGVGGRVQGHREGSLSQSCTDTSSCSVSALNQATDGARFEAISSSLEDGGSSGNDFHNNIGSSKTKLYNNNSSSGFESSSTDCHYSSNINKGGVYTSSGCESSSTSGNHMHDNSNATNQHNSSECGSSAGLPAVDIDLPQCSHRDSSGQVSAPPCGRTEYSEEYGEVFSPTTSIKAFGWGHKHYSDAAFDLENSNNSLPQHGILTSKHKNIYVSDLSVKDSNACSSCYSSFGLTPDKRIFRSHPTDTPSCQKDPRSSNYPGHGKENVSSVSLSYLARPATLSSSSSSNIPCSFMESFINSPVTNSRDKDAFVVNNNNSGNYKNRQSNRTVNGIVYNHQNNTRGIEDSGGEPTRFSVGQIDSKSNEGFPNSLTTGRDNVNCNVSRGERCASTMSINSSSTNNFTTTKDVDTSTSSVDDFLGSSKLDLLTPVGPRGLSALDVFLPSRDRRVLVRACALLWLMKLDQERAARVRRRQEEGQRRRAWMRRLGGSSGAWRDRELGELPTWGSGSSSFQCEGHSGSRGDQATASDKVDKYISETVKYNDFGSKKRMIYDESCGIGEVACRVGATKGSSSREACRVNTGGKGRVGYEWRNAVLRRGRNRSSFGANSDSLQVTTNSFYRQSYSSDRHNDDDDGDNSVYIDEYSGDHDDDEDDGYGTSRGIFRRRVHSDDDHRCPTDSGIELPPSLPGGGGGGGGGSSQTCAEEMSSSVDLTPPRAHRYFVGVMGRYGDERCFHRNPTFGWRGQFPGYTARLSAGSSASFTHSHPLQVSAYTQFMVPSFVSNVW